MSFYGNVFYEFAELFRHFKFMNSGYQKTEFPATKPDDEEAKAQERWDILNMDSGNRWIILKGNEDGVEFYHAQPGSANKDYATDLIQNFSVEGTGGTGATTLACGSTFSTPQLQFDKAGHFTTASASSKNYKLPTAASIYNDGAPNYTGVKTADGIKINSTATSGTQLKEGDYLTSSTINVSDKGTVSGITNSTYILPVTPQQFTTNQTSTGFSKLTSSPGGSVELEAGDCFSTDVITVNKKGAITDISKKYYKLPISDEVVQLDAITERVDIIEEDLKKIPNNYATQKSVEDLSKTIDGLLSSDELNNVLKDYVVTNDHEALSKTVSDLSINLSNNYYTKESVDKTVENINDTLTTLDDTYAKIVDIGVIDDVYNEKTSITDKFDTITAAMGNLEESDKAIYSTDKTETVHSIAAQLTQLSNIIGALDSLYSKNTEVLDEDKFKSIVKAIGNLEVSSSEINPGSEDVLNISEQLTKVNSVATNAQNNVWSITQNVKQIYEPFFALKDLIEEDLKPRLNSLEDVVHGLTDRVAALEKQ